MKKKIEIIISHEVAVIIPDDKVDEILGGFRSTMNADAELNDLYSHIAYTMATDRYSDKDFVDGIGSLAEHGIEHYFISRDEIEYEII